DVVDAATVDGAGFWRRNYQIILPIIAPIVVIALIFGTVFTFTDLSVVYLLTKGGPINATQVLGSLAFQVGILSGDVAHGAVICLFLFPFLLIAVVFMLRALRRREIGHAAARRKGPARRIVLWRGLGARHVRRVPVLLDAAYDVQIRRRPLQSQIESLLVQCRADAGAHQISVRGDPVRAVGMEHGPHRAVRRGDHA